MSTDYRHDLVRYDGITWNGLPGDPLLTPMPDGYWTPWHVAARLPQPIPVSERLPGEADCDKGGRCWWFAESYDGLDTAPIWALTWRSEDDTHWLPHWALPLPEGGPNA